VNVPSLEFLTFCAIVAALLALSAVPVWRRSVLLVANLAFFFTFAQGVMSLVPFVAFLAIGYLAMRIAESYKHRLAFGVIVTLLTLGFCWLKRYAFFPDSTLLSGVFVTAGLSYVFFRVISLVVDAFQGALPARVGIATYVNYTLNFTTFVAGPIQMYAQYHRDEVVRPPLLNASVAGRALERIVIGFFKVTVLSPVLLYANERSVALAAGPLSTIGSATVAALILSIFPIYLYVNFSGYTDVVIGAARFLRMELPENFNQPFSSRGALEFWSRWHMSLSTWFKTYVFSPLMMGLMQRFPSRSVEPLLGVIAYFITFFLVGVWHGQTAMFLILGLLYGAGVSGNKLFEVAMVRTRGRAAYQKLCANPVNEALSSGLTFLWFAVSLVFFWMSWQQCAHLVGFFGFGIIAVAAVAIVFVAAALYRLARLKVCSMLTQTIAWPDYVRLAWCTTLAVAVISVAVVLNAPAPHVVYKAF